MSSMVAFISSPIDTLLQPATRALAPSRTCTVVPSQPFKSNPRCHLRETNLTTNTRWGSRSRDPVGYVDGESSYGNYLSLTKLDPSGLKIVKGMCHCSYTETDELPGHAGGAISCENGILVPIVNRDTPEAIDLARCGFLDCNIEHENDHIDFYNEHCPGVCKKTRLGGDWCFADPIPRKKYRLMKIGPPKCLRATECRAYAASLKCIAKKLRALLREPNNNLRCIALGIRLFSLHTTLYESTHRCRDSDSPLNPQIELDPDVNEIGIWIVENDLFPKG